MAEQVKDEKELTKWEKEWCEMMVKIFIERQMMLKVRDTGKLMTSVDGSFMDGKVKEFTHKFLRYGIFVALGVGKGYRHGNGGNLEFLDKEYRKKHKMGKPRQRRDWFSKKYFYSIRRLNEREAEWYGERYSGMVTTALDVMFKGKKILRNL